MVISPSKSLRPVFREAAIIFLPISIALLCSSVCLYPRNICIWIIILHRMTNSFSLSSNLWLTRNKFSLHNSMAFWTRFVLKRYDETRYAILMAWTNSLLLYMAVFLELRKTRKKHEQRENSEMWQRYQLLIFDSNRCIPSYVSWIKISLF